MKAPTPQIERIEWVEGSLLTRRDLADAIEHEARMLALHVATMHGTWGVAFGLRVTIGSDLHSLRLSAGMAYTARGDTVVVRDALTVLAPVGPGTRFDLLLSPEPTSTTRDCGSGREATCTGTSMVPMPTVRWSASPTFGLGSDIRLGSEIPIARVTRAANGTLSAVDYSQRRTAASLARPHVVSGIARAGQVAWNQSGADLYATIDTDAAGFTEQPVYCASVGNDPAWPRTLVGPLAGIEQASETSFTLRLVFGASPGVSVSLPLLLAHARTVDIAWTGVERAFGCPSTFSTFGSSSNPWSAP